MSFKVPVRIISIFCFISLIIGSSSCSEQATEKDISPLKRTSPLDFSDIALSYSEIRTIGSQISNIQTQYSQNLISQDIAEQRTQQALQPMVANGRAIYARILENVRLDDPQFELTTQEIEAIQNMSDPHMAEISLIMGIAYSPSGWDQDTVLNCLSAALGIYEIANLIENTRQLMTAQGTIRVIKLIGRRYLGWLGVMLAIHSFGDCMEAW